jgi:hypothetical protein
VRAALDTLFADDPSDLVISGTNRGGDTGESLPLPGQGPPVNVPGGPIGGIAATLIDQESASLPIRQLPSVVFNSTFTPSIGSGNPLSEGARPACGSAVWHPPCGSLHGCRPGRRRRHHAGLSIGISLPQPRKPTQKPILE